MATGKKLAPSSPQANLRRYPRYALDVRVKVRMFQDGAFHSCWGRSTEFGRDGIGATLTGELAVGEIVSLDIPLPFSPYPLQVRGIVRYRLGLHYGFEFLTLSTAQRETVARVCEILSAKE